jgi:tricorn protease
MFREAWRLQRDQFWTSDMSGIDWQAAHDRYLPLVARVASRAEFSDLLWEMQGELGTSHCYELGGDYRPEPGWFQGHLGADLALDPQSGRWRVRRIPQGDSWDDEVFSPLAAPGLNIQTGDEILAVGGEEVGRGTLLYERLVNMAHRSVDLTIRNAAGNGGRNGDTPHTRASGKTRKAGAVRTVTVKTLVTEFGLRYRDWIGRNRERVHEATGGRVGYIHVPDMSPHGYSEFHRSYLSEVDRDGLVIDVRWNGGGHVSQLLLEKLLRRRVGYDVNRWGLPEPYPTDSPSGPMVAITNEYAGSDGDIFSHCFKLFGLGPLIGKRTWGGVVGIWPRHALVDGTVTTQPEFAFWFEDVGLGVENYGTDPDIEVEIKPQDHAAGRDPQLERALKEIQKQLVKRPPQRPDFKGRPRLGAAGLPAADRT